MCTHRTVGRWGQVWTIFCQVALGGFALIEGAALLTGGITLSEFLRRLFGLQPGDEPPCTHSRFGRAFVVGFAVWLAAHIGWGRFGVGARRPRQQCTVRRTHV